MHANRLEFLKLTRLSPVDDARDIIATFEKTYPSVLTGENRQHLRMYHRGPLNRINPTLLVLVCIGLYGLMMLWALVSGIASKDYSLVVGGLYCGAVIAFLLVAYIRKFAPGRRRLAGALEAAHVGRRRQWRPGQTLSSLQDRAALGGGSARGLAPLRGRRSAAFLGSPGKPIFAGARNMAV